MEQEAGMVFPTSAHAQLPLPSLKDEDAEEGSRGDSDLF